MMASENKNKKKDISTDLEKIDSKVSDQIKEVSPWVERIGVYVVGLMTTLGLALIMYTGVRAATFNPVEESPELLTHEDITSKTDDNDADASDDEDTVDVDNEEDTDSKDEEDSDAKDSDDEEDANKEEDADEDEEETNDSTNYNGVINSDAVNVREQPQANDQTEIVAVLNTGDKIKVLDSTYNNIWMQVEYNGEIAYVSRDLIDLID